MKAILMAIWLMLSVVSAGVWHLGEDPSGMKYWVIIFLVVVSAFFMLLGMSGRD